MSNRSYQNLVSVPDMLTRMIAAASAGKTDEAKSLGDIVAVQSAKQKSFGKSAIPDAAYDPRSSVTRAKFEGMESADVAQSGLTHCNDGDYGPPTSNEHKLTEWITTEVTNGISKGLPPVVAARRCAARILAKNAKRFSVFQRDAVHAMNELLLRLDPCTTRLLTMNQAFEGGPIPSDRELEADTRSIRVTSENNSRTEDHVAPASEPLVTHTETVDTGTDTDGVETGAEAETLCADNDSIDTEASSVNELDTDPHRVMDPNELDIDADAEFESDTR